MDKQSLIDAVLEQITKDIQIGDLTAIECLVAGIPEDILENYIEQLD